MASSGDPFPPPASPSSVGPTLAITDPAAHSSLPSHLPVDMSGKRSTVGSRFQAQQRRAGRTTQMMRRQAAARATTDPAARSSGPSLTEQRDRLLAAIARVEAELATTVVVVRTTSAALQALRDEKEMNDLIAFNGGTWTVT